MTTPASFNPSPVQAPAETIGLVRSFRAIRVAGDDMRERAARLRALAERFAATDFVAECETLRRSIIGRG
jgi:hypothetical protein